MNATTTHEPKNPVPTTAPLVPCTIDANGIATVRLGREPVLHGLRFMTFHVAAL